MATIKSYSDLKQSKVLSKILSDDSADMSYKHFVADLLPEGYCISVDKVEYETDIPCWSLSALLSYLKSKNKFPEIKELSDGRFKLTTFIWDGKNSIQVSIANDLVDACYEMIIKMHELNLL